MRRYCCKWCHHQCRIHEIRRIERAEAHDPVKPAAYVKKVAPLAGRVTTVDRMEVVDRIF